MKIRYIFIFFVFLLSTLLLINIFFLKTPNMRELKKQRQKYLTNLAKDKPIKFGVVWTFPPIRTKDDFKNGILLAVKKLNKKKVLGRKINIVFKNDQKNKNRAEDIAVKFVNDKNIVAVIAHDDVDIAVPASIIYEYAGIVMISPAITPTIFTRKNFHYIFRNTPSDLVIGKRIADFAKQMVFRKIIVLNSRDTYSQGLTDIFTERAKDDGLKIVYTRKFDPKEREFSKIITDISPKINRQIDYDAIFVAGGKISVPILIKKARAYGIYAPFLSGGMLDYTSVLKKGKEMDGTIVSSIFNPNIISERTQKFIESFRKLYNHTPDTWGAQGYDAIMLLATTIRKIKSLNPKLIARELKYTRNYQSIFGDYSINTKGDVIGRKIYFKVIKNKKFKYITKDSY